MTPVGASVLEITPPEDQGGVPAGYEAWKNGRTPTELFVVRVLLAAAAVVVVIVVIVIVVVSFSFKLVHHLVLSEPLDGLLAAGLEAAGEHALLGNKARHGDI